MTLLTPGCFHSTPAAEASAASAATPPEVKALGEEVLAHLRDVVGSDSLLAAYNAARESVKGKRAQRKRKAALQVLSNAVFPRLDIHPVCALLGIPNHIAGLWRNHQLAILGVLWAAGPLNAATL